MPSNVCLRRLTIESFRGFRDRQEFDLSASAVIVAGPNGTGKTSFFDAIQWVLVGRLERLETLRARRNVEHIVNQYRLGERAEVILELKLGHQLVRVRRVGDYRGSTLEFSDESGSRLFGDEAEERLKSALVPHEAITLEMALTTSGMLQQDVMRSVLEAKPAERYRHISSVLGLSDLEAFEEAARDAAREASKVEESARAERDRVATSILTARERLEAAQDRQRRRPSVDAARQALESLIAQVPAGLVVDMPREPTPETISQVALAAEALGERLRHHFDEVQSLRLELAELASEPTEDEIVELQLRERAAEEAAARQKAEVELAAEQLNAAERESQGLARLAAAAIPLLADQCPVCSQHIDRADVEQELRARASESAALMALREALDARRRAAADAVALHWSTAQELRAAVELKETWGRVRARREKLAADEARLVGKGAPVRLIDAMPEGLQPLAPAIIGHLSELRGRLEGLADLLDRGADAGEVDRAEAEIASFEDALENRTRRLEALSQRASLLKNLAETAVEARVAVTEQRFRAIQPLVADIYSRLDPHPAFKTIEFELDTYYRRGTTSPVVRDLMEDVSADPLMIFSASQANIAALSYFLAMGWTAGERSLPFVLLDDPLQSMDDVNVLGFADLCRHLRSQRQLVLSTHERRFASLLRRKLAPRASQNTAVVFEFLGWDRTGPSVRRNVVEGEMLERPLRLLEDSA